MANDALSPPVLVDAGPRLPSSTANVSDWETSPLFLALSARMAKTEAAVSALSAQVAQLSMAVKSALPYPPHHLAPPSLPPTFVPPQTVFSPFDDSPVPAPARAPSPFAPPTPATQQSTIPPGERDANNVAALTQQIAALSTSVAQLQRLQHSQVQSQSHNALPRQPSSPMPPPLDRGPGVLPLSGRPFHPSDLISGPLTAPGPAAPPPGGPMLGAPPTARPDLTFGPGPNRPNIHRSISSSVIGGDDKWGPPGPTPTAGKFGNTLAMPPMSAQRDWPSPGGPGLLTPGGSGGVAGNGSGSGNANGSGNGNGNGMGAQGVAAPGAGIVITKWEHLNLKMELLRSISKYGIGPPNKIQARVLPFMLKGSDIIAQAPPTQERIISYVVPALQLCLSLPPPSVPYRGPAVIIVTTTVDQATQCHKLVRNIGGPLGVRSALAAGAAGSSGLQNEIAAMHRDAIHLLVGTPAKLNEILNSRGSVSGGECRLLILDEVDQLIARNLYENVLGIARLLPPPKRGSSTGTLTPGGAIGPFSPGNGLGVTSPFGEGQQSPFNPNSKTPFPGQTSRFGPNPAGGQPSATGIERQTCIFSNTVPTDVINFSQSLNVRDPVRVLVRREGGVNSQESVSSVTPGINLKHTYVYLTITGSARSDGSAPADNGPGTIGSGRTAAAAGGQMSEEATRAKEYKLDTLVKMLDDYPLWQAIIHVGTFNMLEAVVYKLQSRSWDNLYLAPDMPPAQKKAVLQQWRLSLAGNGPRFLVVFDVSVKPPEIPWAPLVINFDLPRSVEGYAHRAAAAVPPSNRQGAQVNGVIVSFVQAAGGDVEMLRSTECAYRFKSAEIPTVFHDLFQH